MHIHYFCTYYAYYAYHDFSFPFAGHNDSMVIFKSAADSDLSDEDLEEILSCYNEPVKICWNKQENMLKYARKYADQYAGIC